ncbi:envelope glycoprotein E [Beluga whale alphaherpesvirus 1]|uniref:Envelope glycoprotein E n=1 Tax=Beluga whale alphaherpesvirus 1 TaxID=1434720 RepID=A0A286MM87_9ALPH|nr:envelope glycoprotein E [Beluga whale alphaherpesvirus 1]ASW27113.1 envelope glycoprotein E [Beluga whale alphaherpesvirus 1]
MGSSTRVGPGLSAALLALLAPVALTVTRVTVGLNETLLIGHNFSVTPTSPTNVTVGWSVLYADAHPFHDTLVCLRHAQCETELVFANESLSSLRALPEAFLKLRLLNGSTEILAAVADDGVEFDVSNVSVGLNVSIDSPLNRLYLLDVVYENGSAAHEAVVVTVTGPGPGDADANASANATLAPHLHVVHAITPHAHGAHFSTRGYHSHLYAVGEAFNVSVHLESSIYDSDGFTANLEWYFVKPDDSCPLLTIYEPCLYHPNVPACLHPHNARCAFASPYRATTLFSRLYIQCDRRTRDWTAACVGTVYAHPRDYVVQAPNNVDLIFRRTPDAASGTYVFVLRYNDHVETWSYVTVTTSEHLVNAEVVRHLPARGRDHEPDASTPPTLVIPRPGRVGSVVFLGLAVAVLIAASVAVAALGVWLYRRCARRRRLTKPTLLPVYGRLPTTDYRPLAESDTSEDSFEDDSGGEDGSDDGDGSDGGDDEDRVLYTRPAFKKAPPAAPRPAPARSGFKFWLRGRGGGAARSSATYSLLGDGAPY